MKELKMYIGGNWTCAESGETFTSVSPIDGREIASIPSAGPSDVDRAVRAAERAFHPWYHMSQNERSAALCKVAAALRERAGELAELETLEHGTPVREARDIVLAAADKFESNAWLARSVTGESLPMDSEDLVSFIQREPMGVVGVITPWNLPTMMLAVKVSAALAVGNSVVIKPPSVNSAIAIKFVEIVTSVEELPVGLVNIVTGPGSVVGTAIATHPLVDMIAFTGSSETGKEILAASASTVKKCVMELGGNNPVVIMEDADLDEAVRVLGYRQFNNCGQHCSGPGRYYVHEKVYYEFARRMAEAAAAQVVGDPFDPDTTMGPVVSPGHKAKIEGYIEKGIQEGACLYYRGQTAPGAGKGCYVAPTVLTECTNFMTPAQKEIFGPVAVLIKYTDEDNLLQLTNESPYGLCAYIWTRDLNKGLFFLHNLNVGTLFINCQTLQDNQPWGTSVKESGLGKEGALTGLLEYTDQKTVCLRYRRDT